MTHHEGDGAPLYAQLFYHNEKQQYLIKLLMWLAESRVVPSDRE